MKITKRNLKRIIREEILKEMTGNSYLSHIRQAITNRENSEGAYRLGYLDKAMTRNEMEYIIHNRARLEFDFTGVNFSGADLSGLDLSDLNLYKCDFSDANLRNVNFRFSWLDKAKLVGADLSGANLHLTKLDGANLKNANLQNANLQGADLRHVSLEGANLTGAKYDNSWLLPKDLNHKKQGMVFVEPKRNPNENH